MNGEATLYVLNEKGDGVAVVHTSACGTIQHQVQQAVKWEDGGYSYEYVGKNDDGDSVILEKPNSSVTHYEALLVTVDELVAWPRRYRRCQVCSPNVPDSPRTGRSDIVRMRPQSIGIRHFGREFIGIGPLVAITMSADGFQIQGESGSISIPHDGYVEYRR
ncbi:hypothetical protein LQ938_11570 [Microbacterium sp. cx-55]|uniref:hypothetical protein n=1 Tax=Microbacterium sp. cx-55 TaxID=2875948 RepID=UPI001CBF4DCA|nr:hypothetical protein [Microbacterium sp. cx-55]MBZ4488086.1 hypothetical protein [Microbacterium sp. cx-55]UGB34505.1 hypothetical protein LQ938_11570 [Microbacterium sp. cx-55]